ncbi:SPOR domain-containing protein [Carboxylicivirga marina]|uniref:HU domain-containing protein n=1 Tax=Carboxylicivirga marina TaxID=2800988 RepID=UPI0025986EBF|nr:SPOR domain-containing protein [uncultured Carboxylicivirga sp.]
MTAVDQHISNLLFTHECVIIPELGALVSTNVSARFDADKNMFLPPSKEIGFNRSLSHNDGLLISTLAQANDTSYGKAKIMVEEFVAGIRANIENGTQASISKVGILKKDALGYLQFVADNSEAYLTDAYGLSSFHFKPVVSAQKPLTENAQVRRLLQPVGLKQIAASVAMIVGLFAISQSLDNPVRKDLQSANALSIIMPATSNEYSSEESLTVSREDIQEAIEDEEPVVKNSYYLIAGSFKTESQAKRFLKIVQEMGEEQAFVLASPNSRYRVALNGYPNKTSAVNDLGAYRQLEDFKTVWVLTQR